MLDTDFNLIDSFQCGNGFEQATDAHEFRIYPDGHLYIEADDVQTIDMSQVVFGGDTAAIVRGFTVQRLDADHNVVFQWRSWDYFPIADAVAQINLTSHFIDLVHGNSIEEDADGNLIMSERHLCEITKINSTTGDFIWRMGGENNEFTFLNDNITPPFYFQHYVRLLPNGHLILFDNNNYQIPQQSYAKEYSLDQVNHVATLVWSYAHPYTSGNPVFARAGGNAQRLSNGNTVICWGLIMPTADNPNFTEVDSLGNIKFEFEYDDSNQYIYRVTKHVWQTCDAVATNVNEVVKDSRMVITPNPASGNFSLSLYGFNHELLSLEIENMLGEIIYERKINSDASSELNVSLPNAAAGIYVCTIKGRDKKLQQKVVLR